MAPPAPPTSEEMTDGATAQTNGPVTGSGENGPRRWERPWTTSEIRQEANNWSLAGDAGLLQHLQEFSQRVLSRTHEIEQEVDGLVHEAKLTSVRVNNVFNDFIMLANTQFVENRVYDEDVSQESKDEVQKPETEEKTREEREAALVPKVSEALRYGLNVIDAAFEKLDSNVVNSDTDDDDDTDYRVDPILEAKDPYVNRPLPCLIGTPAFWQDDNVGLLEDVSESEESDQGSISESEEEKVEYSDSEEEQRIKTRQQKLNKYSDDSETESEEEESETESEGELFGNKEKKHDVDESSEEDRSTEGEKEENETSERQVNGGVADFTSELASKIGAAIPKRPPAEHSEEEEENTEEKPAVREVRAASTTKKEKQRKLKEDGKKKHKAKTQGEEGDLFGASPEQDDDLFGKSGGLFSTSSGLFDDDNDGGLFDDIEKKSKTKKASIVEEEEEEEKEEVVKEPEPKTKSGKKIPKGAVSVFGGGDDALFGESDKQEDKNNSKQQQQQQQQQSVSKPTRSVSGLGVGLFDDDDDEGDDLFSVAPKKSTPVTKERAGSSVRSVKKDSKPSSKDLFADDEDEDDDLFSATSKPEKSPVADVKPKQTKPEKKLPAGAVSMFAGGVNPLTAALKKQRPVSDSEEEKLDVAEGDKSRSSSIRSSKSSGSVASVTKSSGSVASVTKRTAPSPSPSANSLFGDEDIDDSLFTKSTKDSKPKPKTTASSLFADDDDDDLFGSANKPSPKPPQTKKEDKSKTNSAGLFDSDGDNADDFFSSTSKTKDTSKKKPVGGVALFGGADILSKKPPVEKKESAEEKPTAPLAAATAATAAAAAASPRKTTVSLFDAEEEDDSDLFGSTPASKPAQKKDSGVKSRTKSKSLFEDEDLLFGASEESPNVDLFSKSTPPTPQPTPSKPNPAPTNTVTKIGGATTTASTTDLFDDEDDDDDLFGTVKPKSTPAPVQEKVDVQGVTTTETSDAVTVDDDKVKSLPVETKRKKPAGAVSMFGGMDPAALLKKKPPAEDKTEKTGDEKPKEKPVDPLTEKDKDDDHLLSSSPGKSKMAPPIVKPKPQRSDSAKSVEKIPSLEKKLSIEKTPSLEKKPSIEKAPSFEKTPSVEKSEKESEKEESPKTTKPKKPVGGVSIFGGFDPMAGLLKRSVSVPERAEPPDEATDKKDVPESTLAENESASHMATSATESVVKTTAPSKIGKLKVGLSINPAALLPGAAPPVKEDAVVAATFDEPASAKPLHNVNKDRAKLTRRRPMSRKGRKSMVLSQSFDDFTLPSPTEVEESSAKSSQSDSGSKSHDAQTPPSQSIDLFGNDDLLGEKSDTPKPLVSETKDESDIFSKGLFEKSEKESSVSAKNKDNAVDELFSDASSKAKDSKSEEIDSLFSTKSSSAGKEGKDLAKSSKVKDDADDDDLFASAKSSVKSKSVLDESDGSSKKEASSKPDSSSTKDISSIDDSSKGSAKSVKKTSALDEDDIFADSSINKKKESKVKVDDDIFASSKLSSTPAAKAVKEDDDIFGSVDAKEKKRAKKPAAVKDESLFKDDTDIFADIPSAKPKEPRKKKKVAPTEKKSIFKDDIDDIFADSSPVASKPKKQSKQKSKDTSRSSPAADDVDIFDDPLLGGK